MNKKYVLWNLREALEEIRKTIAEIEADPGYEYGDFVIGMTQVYHHINTAWNARDASEAESEECSEANFKRWRKMPAPSALHLEE